MGQKLRDLLGGVELPAGLAGGGGVHLHQVFVGVAEQVDGVVGEVARAAGQRQVADGVEQLDQLFVALGHGGAELAAVDIEVVEQALDVVLGIAARGRALDVGKDAGERFVEVGVMPGAGAHVGKQFGRKDVKAFFLHRLGATEFGIVI